MLTNTVHTRSLSHIPPIETSNRETLQIFALFKEYDLQPLNILDNLPVNVMTNLQLEATKIASVFINRSFVITICYCHTCVPLKFETHRASGVHVQCEHKHRYGVNGY